MQAIALVSLAAALWGTVGVVNGLMTGGVAVDPAIAGLARTALGGLTLLLAAELRRLPWRGAERPPVRLLLVFGLAGAVFQVCLFAAFVEAGVTVTVAVTVAAPVVLVALWDAAWNRLRPEPGTLAAIAIAAAGAVLALTGGRLGSAVVEWRGAALLVAASVAFAVVAAAARGIGERVHPLRGAGLGLSVTAAAMAAVVLARPQADLSELAALPWSDLAILAYIGILATGGAYLAFVLGLARSRSASTGLVATLIEPGVAALLAAIVLRERLAAPEALGCLLMLVAMLVLFRAERRARAAAA